MSDTDQQVRNRIAMWRAEIANPTDPALGPSVESLLDSLESDARLLGCREGRAALAADMTALADEWDAELRREFRLPMDWTDKHADALRARVASHEPPRFPNERTPE